MSKRPILVILALTLSSGGMRTSVAQEPSSPDLIVTLNEGIYYYLFGLMDEDKYSDALERLTSVLEVEPDNTTALLFRALTRGRLALLERERKVHRLRIAKRQKEILSLRHDPERQEALARELRQAREAVASEDTPAAEKRVVQWMVENHELLLRHLERERETPDAQLEIGRGKRMRESFKFANEQRDHYLHMLADVKRAIATLDRPEAVLRLLEAVAMAKVARIDEEEARGIVRGDLPVDEATGTVKVFRTAAAARLGDAANVLEALLAGLSAGDVADHEEVTRVRAKFFLGVIRYRQAVPMRAEAEILSRSGRKRVRFLQRAERLMKELADDDQTPNTWRSYAAFYLSLIIPFRAAEESDTTRRDAALDEADRRLTEATRLDAEVREKGSVIATLAWRQRRQIEKLREAPASATPPRKDLGLTLFAGARRDTNVVLLGDRTDLPRGISRTRDYGVTAGAALDYTWDFSDRWTFGGQVRTSQLWNIDVDEFDQQSYGVSAALQYELMSEREGFGPVYLAVQYDGDYTLLGRSAFLESHAITPSVRVYSSNRRGQTDLFLAVQVRDYFEPVFDPRFNRDGTYVKLGMAHRFKVMEMTGLYEKCGWEPWGLAGDEGLVQNDPDYPQRYLTPYVGLSYGWDATDGDEFDRKALSLSLGVGVPLPWGLQLDASALLEWEDYSHNSLIDFHRRGRRDVIQEYGIALSRTFVLRAGERINRYTPAFDRVLMTVRAHANWTDDDSNVVDRVGQAIFEYDRAVYGLAVAFSFN